MAKNSSSSKGGSEDYLSKIYTDTNVIIAYINKNHELHKKAEEIINYVRGLGDNDQENQEVKPKVKLVTSQFTVKELEAFYIGNYVSKEVGNLKDEKKTENITEATKQALENSTNFVTDVLKRTNVEVVKVDECEVSMRAWGELKLLMPWLEIGDLHQIAAAEKIGASKFLTFDKRMLDLAHLIKSYTKIEVTDGSDLK